MMSLGVKLSLLQVVFAIGFGVAGLILMVWIPHRYPERTQQVLNQTWNAIFPNASRGRPQRATNGRADDPHGPRVSDITEDVELALLPPSRPARTFDRARIRSSVQNPTDDRDDGMLMNDTLNSTSASSSPTLYEPSHEPHDSGNASQHETV